MIRLYSYAGPGGTFAGAFDADEYAPLAPNCTDVAPPPYSPPNIPTWTGAGWRLIEETPNAQTPEHSPGAVAPRRELAKIAFERLFTVAETLAVIALTDQAEALTPAQLVDPANQGLAGFRVYLRRYAALPEILDLDDADTIAGVWLLQSMGVLTSERAADILAGRAPPAG